MTSATPALSRPARYERLLAPEDASRATAVNAGEEVSGFGQHRLGRHQKTSPAGEGTTALQVVRLAASEKRNECTGVEQQLTGHVSTT